MRANAEAFYNKTTGGFPKSSCRVQLNVHPDQLFSPSATAAKLLSVSRTSFIVASVIEDLKNRWTSDAIRNLIPNPPNSCLKSKTSVFRDLAEIVYGEADVCCAAFARKHGSSVLSQDSDLFLHDLGCASLIFLDSLTLTESGLLAREWRPSTISKRLGLKSVQHLGFEIKRDPSASLATLVQRSKRVHDTQASCEFATFLKEYDVQAEFDVQDLQIFDPRASELYAQFRLQRFVDENGSPHMFLPILLENYTRSTACAQGSEIRVTAYSLLNQSLPSELRRSSVIEYMRRGSRVAAVEVPLLPTDLILEYLQCILDKVVAVQQICDGGCSSIYFWKVFALCELFSISPKDRIGLLLLKRYLETGKSGDNLQWNDIHMLAQLEAILYSMKILATFATLALSSLEGDLKILTTRCTKSLGTLSSVQTVAMANIRQPLATRLAEAICSMIGGQDDELRQANNRQNIKRKQKRRRGHTDSARVRYDRRCPDNKTRSNMNAFDILQSD